MYLFQMQAQNSTKEFWLSFFGTVDANEILADPAVLDLYVLISSEKGCTGTIENPNTGYSKSFAVAPGAVEKVSIPYAESYSTSEGDTAFVAQKGILVTTSDSASVYLGNFQASSFDASVVFPAQSLGTSYRTFATNHVFNLSQRPMPEGGWQYVQVPNYSTFVVVATEDNTQIKFSIPQQVSFNGTTYLPNTDYYQTLNRGETFALAGIGILGANIESEDCKKIAVFSGNYCSNVPWNAQACDVLVEQMVPVKNWGKEFVLINTLDRIYDSKILVLSKEDNTTVTIKQENVNQTYLLGKNDFLDFFSDNSGTIISSDNAIGVVQLAVGSTLGDVGDPMMMWINPEEQMISNSIFASPQGVHVKKHYVLIFVKTEDVAQTILDGVNIGSQFQVFPQDNEYSFARIEISPATHQLQNANGFLAYAYGYDEGGNYTQESYGYSLNATFFNLEDKFSLSNKGESYLYYETNDNNIYSFSDTIQIERYIESNFVAVLWLINGNPYPVAETSQAQLEWKLPATALLEGSNTLSMLIDRFCEEDTLTTTLRVATPSIDLNLYEVDLCLGDSVLLKATSDMAGVFHWINAQGDTTTNANGEYWHKTTQSEMEDVLYVYAEYDAYRSATDSILVRVHQAQQIVIYDSVLKGDTYYFGNQRLTEAGEYTAHLKSIYGCDSIVTLHLNLSKRYGNEIDIPQGFSPNGDGKNDYFYIPEIDHYPQNKLVIFNRWGNNIYEASPYINNWDGRSNRGITIGQDLPVGTYFYIIELDDSIPAKKGFIYLSR